MWTPLNSNENWIMDMFQVALQLEEPWKLTHIEFKCMSCNKVTLVYAKWARPLSRFTLLFEAWAMRLMAEMPVNTAAQELRGARYPDVADLPLLRGSGYVGARPFERKADRY